MFDPSFKQNPARQSDADPTVDQRAVPSLTSIDESLLGDDRLAVWPEGYTLDGYEVIRTLGGGTSSIVYLVRNSKSGEQVALKVSRRSVEDSKRNSERFIREAETLSRLRHPNICRIEKIGNHDGHLYIAMQYVEGEPLSDWIREESLTEQDVAKIVLRIANALQEAHDHEVVHRDLKPANVLMDRDDNPIVTDFGLALTQASALSARLTQPGLIVGSPAYMSPEQIRDPSSVDASSDVYSLGVVMYQLLTGTLPYTGEIMSVIRKIALESPKPPSEHDPCISGNVSAICLKAIAKSKSDRFSSMMEFANALEPIAEGISARHPFLGNRRFFAMVGTVAVLGVILGGAYWMETTKRDSSKQTGVQGQANASLDSEDSIPVGQSAKPALDEGAPQTNPTPDTSSEIPQSANESRLDRLNALCRAGLRLQLNSHTALPTPLDAIPESVLCVNCEHAEFDDDAVSIMLDVIPAYRRLLVRPDQFTEKAWRRILEDEPQELFVHGPKHIPKEHWDIIGQMTFLRSFEVRSLDLMDDDLRAIEPLENLTYLSIAGNPNVRGAFLNSLSRMRKLETLDLVNTGVQDEMLRRLPPLRSLRILILRQTPIKGMTLNTLSTLPKLRTLQLDETDISNESLHLIAELKVLSMLTLHGCEGISDLSPLKQMSVGNLKISGTSVTDLRPIRDSDVIDLTVDEHLLESAYKLVPNSRLRVINGMKVSEKADPSR